MAIMDKLIEVGIAVMVYFALFSAMVTQIALTNWTALSLTWVPTLIYILLAVIPVVGLIGYVKLSKK